MVPTREFTPEEYAANALHPETVSDAVKLFWASGCLILKNVFSTEFISVLREAYHSRYQSYFRPVKHANAAGVGDKRFQITVDLSPPFNMPQLYAHPLVLPILKGIFSGDLVLGSFASVVSLPGSELQQCHRDLPLLFDALVNRFLPPHAVGLFIPLVEFNDLNGTTRMFPGSHHKNDVEGRKCAFVDPVVLPGSCFLVDYRLFHQGTPNRSERVRPTLYCGYYRSWFKDYKNFKKQPFIMISDAEYAKIPEEHRGLISWIEHYRNGLY